MLLTYAINYILTIYFNNQNYKKATLFFLQDLASIAAVIPAMDKLDNHLNSSMKQSYHHAILAAMKLVHNKINHYYSMTDLSSAYQIALGKCLFFFCVIIIDY